MTSVPLLSAYFCIFVKHREVAGRDKWSWEGCWLLNGMGKEPHHRDHPAGSLSSAPKAPA